jgi:hypothetical protein
MSLQLLDSADNSALFFAFLAVRAEVERKWQPTVVNRGKSGNKG